MDADDLKKLNESAKESKTYHAKSAPYQDNADAAVTIDYNEPGAWAIRYTCRNKSVIRFNSHNPAELVQVQIRGMLSNFAADQLESAVARAWEEAAQLCRLKQTLDVNVSVWDMLQRLGGEFMAKAAALRDAGRKEK